MTSFRSKPVVPKSKPFLEPAMEAALPTFDTALLGRLRSYAAKGLVHDWSRGPLGSGAYDYTAPGNHYYEFGTVLKRRQDKTGNGMLVMASGPGNATVVRGPFGDHANEGIVGRYNPAEWEPVD